MINLRKKQSYCFSQKNILDIYAKLLKCLSYIVFMVLIYEKKWFTIKFKQSGVRYILGSNLYSC